MNPSRKRSAVSPDKKADVAVSKKNASTDTAPPGHTDFLEELLWKQSATLTERFQHEVNLRNDWEKRNREPLDHGSSETLDRPQTSGHVEENNDTASSGGGSPDVTIIDMTGGSHPRQYSHDPLNLLPDVEQYERSLSVAQNANTEPSRVKITTPQPSSPKTLQATFPEVALLPSSSVTAKSQVPSRLHHAFKSTSRLKNRVTLIQKCTTSVE